MSKLEKFEDLEVWQRSRILNKELYSLFQRPGFTTDFRLKNQMNGSGGSVMDNIAEGFERDGNKEFLQYLYIAKASSGELRSQLYRVLDRNYISPTEFEKLKRETTEISSMISGLIKAIKRSPYNGVKRKPSVPT